MYDSAIALTENYAQRVRNKYNHDIRLGVGVGVGLGVPILVLFTALVTWFFAGRSIREQTRKANL